MDYDNNHLENVAPEDVVLPNRMVLEAIHRACDFFNIPEIPTIYADGTCVWVNDSRTFNDDTFGFNREELMRVGIRGEDSLTLIFAHECAHRILQGRDDMPSWSKELASDFFAGLQAGVQHIDISNFEDSLDDMKGDKDHPSGYIRKMFIEEGVEYAKSLEEHSMPPVYKECMDKYDEYLSKRIDLVTENMNALKAAALTSHADGAYRLFIDDADWHRNEAEKAFENENYYRKEAERAADRGDLAKAKELSQLADSYHQKGVEHLDSASRCSSKFFDERSHAVSFTGQYTKEEINSHINDAQDRIDSAKAAMRNHAETMRRKAEHGEPNDASTYSYNSAKIDMENAQKELQKWQNEEPKKDEKAE